MRRDGEKGGSFLKIRASFLAKAACFWCVCGVCDGEQGGMMCETGKRGGEGGLSVRMSLCMLKDEGKMRWVVWVGAVSVFGVLFPPIYT